MIPLVERVRVNVADPELARAMTQAIADAIRAALPSELPAPAPPVVRFRTRKKLARLLTAPEALAGALAVVRVTSANARHLEAWVTEVRRAGVAGVQLVWNGRDPAPERVASRIFRVLEMARATLREAPVMLSARAVPAQALLLSISMKGTSP
ncbi:hypothetical protein LVJ94_08510 [Pendulispora rubella]|uniref:Uncharacterized protein n=1 Tax=Pendulispora rubella TaxID=2741070 RepID=A0ABZ2L927_9BACT